MTSIASVCVYCGSSGRVDQTYKDAATTLGALVAARGQRLIYGGGRVGLMGLAADACLAGGGEVVGIIPGHIQELEVEHHGLTELHIVDSMHTRKRMMFDLSDGFVVLPGGLGTLDELFEILTWRQLSLHDKPIVLANIRNYWDPVLALIDHQIEAGFCRPEHRDLFRVEADVESALDALEAAPVPQVPPQTKWL